MNNHLLATLAQMFYEPSTAYHSLRNKPRGWFPLFLVIALTVAMLFWYFQSVDYQWLKENMLPVDQTPEQREAIGKFLTPTKMMVVSISSVVVVIPLVYSLLAVFYSIASKFMGSDIRFGFWFSLVAWSGVPALTGVILMAFQISTGHGKVLPDDLNMLSLNYLFMHQPMGEHWAGWANNFNVTTIWSVILTAVGVRTWMGNSWSKAISLAATPYILFYGIWAAKLAFLE